MKPSELNHLRRLLGWVRCEIGQTPEELVETMRQIGGKIEADIDDAAGRRLVEAYDGARAVPKYVRAAERALSKMLGDRGEVVDGEASDYPGLPMSDEGSHQLPESWIPLDLREPTMADADSIGDVLFLRNGLGMLGRVAAGIPTDATHWSHTGRK